MAAAPAARSTNGDDMNGGKPEATRGVIAGGKNAVTATTHIHDTKEPVMRAIFGLFLLILIGGSVAGCVIEEPGGWHYHHHFDHY
jgi:hypothetical protein